MSHLFSYEIDERNLRVQLKNLDIPQREEAWQRFESFADAHPIVMQRQAFKGFQFKVNPQALMPVIFGGIILLFSLLLYNFVSIKKDPNAQTAVASAPANKVLQSVLVIKNEASAVTSSPEQKVEVASPVVTTELAVTPTTAVSELTAKPLEKNDAVEQAFAAQAAEKQMVATPEGSVSKKKRRRAEEAALSALKPTVVSEDEEAGEIPQ